jgi:filamentous hemagglutinin
VLDGKKVVGQADHIVAVNGKPTAVDAKYTNNWMASLRNPSSSMGEEPWSAKSQKEMVTQARKYILAYEGGAIYHTNSVEFARFYSRLFRKSGLKNFSFVITPSR